MEHLLSSVMQIPSKNKWVNNDVIKKDAIDNLSLKDGDQIEIITYAAGG